MSHAYFYGLLSVGIHAATPIYQSVGMHIYVLFAGLQTTPINKLVLSKKFEFKKG